MQSSHDSSEVQVGGWMYRFFPDYWNNHKEVQRNPEETCNLIQRYNKEIALLRRDAIAHIVNIFRNHPNRMFSFEYRFGWGWDGSTYKSGEAEAILEYYCPSIHYYNKEAEILSDIVCGVWVDDGVIKINGEIPLGDVKNVEDILGFIIGAKDLINCDSLVTGVYFRDR